MAYTVRSMNPCPVCGGHEWEFLRVDGDDVDAVRERAELYIAYVDLPVPWCIGSVTILDRCIRCDTIFTRAEDAAGK